MTSTRKELSDLFLNIPLFLIGIFVLAFPLLFSVQFTDAFMLPKHILLAVIVTISMVSLGLHMLMEGRIRIRTTPFDLPVIFFTLAVILSAYLSVNKYDSLIAAVPFMYSALLFYILVNTVRTEKSLFYILSCFTLGATLVSILTILGFFRIYPLPFSFTKSFAFTSIGSLLDQAMYLGMVLPVAGYFGYRLISRLSKKQDNLTTKDDTSAIDILFSIAFLAITAGFIITLFHLLTTQSPYLLPFGNGFQIAFASISQDAGRLLKSFLFGSGYGTFLTDFTRFKQPTYNADQALWSVTFLRSSSFVLELLATTGILGLVSFLFIVFKIIREKTLFLPLIFAIVAAFVLPFSPIVLTLFFGLLGLFAIVRSFANAKGYEEIDLHLIAFREPVHSGTTPQTRGRQSLLLSGLIMLAIFGGVAFADFYTAKFVLSDMAFQKSLIAAARNNGSETYRLQSEAIKVFPYRDMYHRVFSQTNLALANSLAQQTPKGSSPSAAVQQNILTLIQQSINTGRSASTLSPYSAMNWNNLSGVYRALIGFGQNADQFAILTNQQAISLDPSNPQQYINLGGIYYQLGLWDEAIRQFQIAIRLKPDNANAYYNAAHALESKGNLNQALTVYEAVKTLVAKDSESVKKISTEIDTLKAKIAESSNVAGAQTETDLPQPSEPVDAEKNDLSVNKPESVLPTRNPKAPIEGPTLSPIPSPTGITPSPTPNQ